VTEIDAALVRRKLAVIQRNLDDLSTVEGLSLDEYRSDRFRLKATERLLQEMVEAAVDINLHLLRAGDATAPPDYYQSFRRVAEERIIPSDLAASLAPATGLRNRLVHEYDEIDDAIVLQAVAEAGRLFPRYMAEVERHVTAAGF
jgi:uncharacterized protein YutE (UPF0331/DUF86 family)